MLPIPKIHEASNINCIRQQKTRFYMIFHIFFLSATIFFNGNTKEFFDEIETKLNHKYHYTIVSDIILINWPKRMQYLSWMKFKPLRQFWLINFHYLWNFRNYLTDCFPKILVLDIFMDVNYSKNWYVTYTVKIWSLGLQRNEKSTS